jgi:hypothetical protein
MRQFAAIRIVALFSVTLALALAFELIFLLPAALLAQLAEQEEPAADEQHGEGSDKTLL